MEQGLQTLNCLTATNFHISLFSLVALVVAGIALYVALLLLLSRTSHRWLTLALLSLVAGLIGAIALGGQVLIPFLFTPGPLIYAYIGRLTRKDDLDKTGNRWVFLPLLLAIPAGYPGLITQAALASLAWLYLLSCLYLCRKLIAKVNDREPFSGGDRYRHAFKSSQSWLTALVWIGLLGLTFTLVSGYNGYTATAQLVSWGYLLVMVAFTGMASQCLLNASSPVVMVPVRKSPLTADLKQKAAWLRNEIKTKRIYEDPELTLTSLAGRLGLTTHELSYLTNAVFKKSFNDLVNEYRVQAVTRKMQDPAYDHLTLLGIAFECGFNSKPTFNRIFKQVTGKSPVEYKALLQKEVLPYNLRRYPQTAGLISEHQTLKIMMFRNYLKTAWRSLLRNKSYATINITGLAIGIAACLLIFLVVRYETSFDTFHQNKDRIYRVVTVSDGPDGTTLGSGTQEPLAEGLRLDFPNLGGVGSIVLNAGSEFAVGYTKKFKEDQAYYADPVFFQLFDFKWLAGDKKTALAEPYTMVLTEDEAGKFFGDWHKAIGQTLRYNNKQDYRVTGILENTPANTDFPLKVVMSLITQAPQAGKARDWVTTVSDRNTYLILPAGSSEQRFNSQLAAFAKRHIPPPYNKTTSLQLQPLSDMHYNTQLDVYGGHRFSRQLITVISLIGLFLLIIACVNFINLATAQAVNRSKEVGIRKVLGSGRPQLVLQFMSETFILTLSALLIGTVAAACCLGLLNQLLESQLSIGLLFRPAVVVFLLLTLIGVTLLAGFYPALVLSGFNPIEALRNKIKAGRASGISLRRVLVVSQFCIAQFLLIGTLVLIAQMDYFKNKPLGFNKDEVITVPFPGDSLGRVKVAALQADLLQQPGIRAVSISSFSPADENGWFSDFRFDHSAKGTDFGASLKWADQAYFKLYDIHFVAGGPYANTDTISGFVVNETLVHKLGVSDPKQAIGKDIMIFNKRYHAPITGVIRDFHAGSLKDAIPPVLMAPWKGFYAMVNIKIRPQNVQGTLRTVENLWNKTYPEGVFEYRFLDKTVANFYKSESQLATLYKVFAGIAIFISCLGLYGLVSFMAVQRVKEVGIRRTLGASTGQIVYLFSREFTLLVLIAFAIAAPVGYYLMHQWLQGFTYRISLGPGIFALAALLSLAIAWLAVGYKAVQAALVNPVKSLRSE